MSKPLNIYKWELNDKPFGSTPQAPGERGKLNEFHQLSNKNYDTLYAELGPPKLS